MNLENKISKKPNFLERIKKGLMPYAFAVGLVAVASCQPSPGPISVENSIKPTTVPSGDNITWEIRVTNYGGKVTIDDVNAHEKAISGWAEGLYDFSADIPITNKQIDAYSTETIFNKPVKVLNTGLDDIIFENTVTVESDGGEDSDTITYTVTNDSYSFSSLKSLDEDKEYSTSKASGIVQGLFN